MSEEPESAHRSLWPVSDVDKSAHRSSRHELIEDTQVIQAIPAFGPVLAEEQKPWWRGPRFFVVHMTHAREGQDSRDGTGRMRIKRFWREASAERYLERLTSARRRVYSALLP